VGNGTGVYRRMRIGKAKGAKMFEGERGGNVKNRRSTVQALFGARRGSGSRKRNTIVATVKEQKWPGRRKRRHSGQ